MFDLAPQVSDAVHQLYNIHGIPGWEPDDLFQEVMLRAMVKLDKFEGNSSLKTWVLTLARNHLCSLARTARRKAKHSVLRDQLDSKPRKDDFSHRIVLRGTTKELLSWLRMNPDGVYCGWEVLNLLLKTHADYDYTAFALTMHTGRPWTARAVRVVVDRIQGTPRGLALCQALGIFKEE